MSQRIFSISGIAGVAVAALLFAVSPASAQHHGGGGHGGGGGYHGGGGGHGGGYHGGGGYHSGGYHGGGYHGGGYGYHGGYGRGGWGYGGWGLGLGSLYLGLNDYYRPGYSYGAYYPSYDTYAPSYNYYSVAPSVPYYPSNSGYYMPPADYAPGATMPPADASPGFALPGNVTTQSITTTAAPVYVTVQVPADAQVWFNNAETRQTGATRSFVSPPLDPGQTYTYTIRAQWMQNGQEVSQKRAVDVQAGGHPVVNFLQPAK